MDKKKAPRTFLDNKRNVLIVALMLALLAWVIVAGFIDPNQEKTISGVIINYSTNMGNYKNWGLEIVDGQRASATVTVHGDGADINPLTISDVSVYCDYSNITEAGTYDVPLKASAVTLGNYEIIDVNPKTVRLTFESVSTKNLSLQVVSDGITAADGYYKDSPVPSTLQVEVSGPESEMRYVESAVVVIVDEAQRNSNYTASDVQVRLLDEAGNEIQTDLVSIEPAVVNVEIPILPTKELPISVNIVGTPPNFDSSWFQGKLTYSEQSILVAGDAATLAGLDELVIGSIDVSTFTLDTATTTIALNDTLPSGIRILDNVTEVEITLDTSELAERTISVPMANVSVVNAPAGTSVVTNTTTGSYEVTLVGPEETIYALTAENVVVEIDATGVSEAEGGRQQRLAARVYVPRSGRVYAVESYEIVCRVSDA